MARPTRAQAASTQQRGYPVDWNVPQSGSLFGHPTGLTLLYELQDMAENDETAGSMLWVIGSVLGQTDFKHKAMKDGKAAPKDPEAVRMAEFADTLLDDMTGDLAPHIEEGASTTMWAGFMLYEVVLKQRTADNSKHPDKYYGVDKLVPINPLTILQWNYADRFSRDVIGARQMTYTGAGDLPMWKLLHYKFATSMMHPMGRPLFKSARRAWLLKRKIQDSEAIGIERDLCGLPMFRMPEDELVQAQETGSDGKPTEAAVQAMGRIMEARKAVTDMRYNKSGGLILPSNTWTEDGDTDRTPKYDFKIVTTAGQKSIDGRTAVRDYDRAIARTGLMQFLQLGDRSSGSFGLSDDQSNMAVRSLISMANKMTGEWDRKTLPIVWAANGFDPVYLPSLWPSAINKDGIQQLGAYLSGVGRASDLWGGDTRARTALLDAANIDHDPAAQDAAATTFNKAAELGAKPKPAPDPAAQDGNPNENL